MTTFGAVAVVTLKVKAFVPMRPALSVTLIVTLKVPCAFVLPLITPAPLKVTPLGNAPETMLHTFPPAPPVAASVVEYAMFGAAFGSVALEVIVGAVPVV